MDVRQSFAKCLRKARDSSSLSQKELSAKTGFTAAEISSFELGKTKPCTGGLRILAETLNVSVDYLLGLSQYKAILRNEGNFYDS